LPEAPTLIKNTPELAKWSGLVPLSQITSQAMVPSSSNQKSSPGTLLGVAALASGVLLMLVGVWFYLNDSRTETEGGALKRSLPASPDGGRVDERSGEGNFRTLIPSAEAPITLLLQNQPEGVGYILECPAQVHFESNEPPEGRHLAFAGILKLGTSTPLAVPDKRGTYAVSVSIDAGNTHRAQTLNGQIDWNGHDAVQLAMTLEAAPSAGGMVVDRNQEPVGGGKVRFEHLNTACAIGADGRFSIGPVNPEYQPIRAELLSPEVAYENEGYRFLAVSALAWNQAGAWSPMVISVASEGTLNIIENAPRGPFKSLLIRPNESLIPGRTAQEAQTGAALWEEAFARRTVKPIEVQRDGDGGWPLVLVPAEMDLAIELVGAQGSPLERVDASGQLASKQGAAGVPIRVLPGGEKTVLLKAPGWADILVTRPDGSIVPQATVSVEFSHAPNRLVTTDQGGRHRLWLQGYPKARGELRLYAYADYPLGRAPGAFAVMNKFSSRSRAHVVDTGLSEQEIVLVVSPAPEITGTVLWTNCEFEGQRRVTAVAETASSRSARTFSSLPVAWLKPDGHFALRTEPDGIYTVRIWDTPSRGGGLLWERYGILAGTQLGQIGLAARELSELTLELGGGPENVESLQVWAVSGSSLLDASLVRSSPLALIQQTRLEPLARWDGGYPLDSGGMAMSLRLRPDGSGATRNQRPVSLPVGKTWFVIPARQGFSPDLPLVLGPYDLVAGPQTLAIEPPRGMWVMVHNATDSGVEIVARALDTNQSVLMFTGSTVDDVIAVEPSGESAFAIQCSGPIELLGTIDNVERSFATLSPQPGEHRVVWR
jgi:hypothetical protein